MDGYQGPTVHSALRLAPLVFVRPGELRTAAWADINLDAAEWRYTVTKTSTPHIVPLSRQAVDILRELHPLTGRGRFVFPGARTNGRPMSDNAILAAMRRMGISNDKDSVETYLTDHNDSWRNAKHRQQWRSTLETYAFPTIGGLPLNLPSRDLRLQRAHSRRCKLRCSGFLAM